jgi:hypothetical protein
VKRLTELFTPSLLPVASIESTVEKEVICGSRLSRRMRKIVDE